MRTALPRVRRHSTAGAAYEAVCPARSRPQLLGFHLRREEVEGILSEVDHDGSGARQGRAAVFLLC
jgi:hypothetical protein